MRNYIIKRIAQSVLILFCVMFIIYALIRCLPSSFAETMAMQLAQAPGAKPYEEWLAQLNASYGLDLDIVPGFFTWLSKAIVGNFGDSWKWNVPATQKFQEVVGLSVIMGGISFVLSIIIAVPLGILAATKQYSRTDYVITAAALVGISLPTFFFATLLKLLFSVKLGWFDLYGLVGRDYAQLDSMGQFLDKANHLVLPIATLVIVSIGGYMRYTRTNMLEVLNADYIRTARAKGLSEHTVIYKHAFRNADPAGHHHWRQPARPVQRCTDHRDAVLHPRHRLHFLPVDGRRRYSLYDVLPVLYGSADPGQQPADRHPVRRGRPARTHFLRKETAHP